MRIRIPSLRDRLGDVPELVDFMLQRLLKDRKSKVRRVSAEALQVLCQYGWPGNVRDLENTIQRSAVVAQGDTILKKDLPQEILDAAGKEQPADAGTPLPDSLSLDSGIPDVELEGNVTVAAAAGIPLEELLDRIYETLRGEHEKDLLQVLEKEMTIRALRETGGNQVRTSALLGITRATLRKRIESYGLTTS